MKSVSTLVSFSQTQIPSVVVAPGCSTSLTPLSLSRTNNSLSLPPLFQSISNSIPLAITSVERQTFSPRARVMLICPPVLYDHPFLFFFFTPLLIYSHHDETNEHHSPSTSGGCHNIGLIRTKHGDIPKKNKELDPRGPFRQFRKGGQQPRVVLWRRENPKEKKKRRIVIIM